jgi:uncharacterized protein (DUF58 family)
MAKAKAEKRAKRRPPERPFPVPAPRLALLLCLPLAVSGAGLAFPALQRAAALIDVLIVVVCAVDLAFAIGLKAVRPEFAARYAFPLGRPAALAFELRNPLKRRLDLRLALDMSDDFIERIDTAAFRLAPGRSATGNFLFKPMRRGEYPIEALHERIDTPLGLFRMQFDVPAGLKMNVMPDVAGTRGYLKAARSNRSTESGLHPALRRGGESELDYLREYRQDDDPRRIDWKASCRLGRPITKVLRCETARNVIFALDSGRLMTAEQGGLSSLDYAVNSVLMLARVALEMDDAVSVVAFSGTIRGEVPFVRGRRAILRISDFLSALEPDFSESNYEQAFDRIMRRISKRSLVIVVSDMSDGLNADVLVKYFAALSRRHLPLLVLLRDSRLEGWARSASAAGEAASDEYSRAAAREMSISRQKAVSLLRARGVTVLDLLPREISAAMADKYLELKSRGMI